MQGRGRAHVVLQVERFPCRTQPVLSSLVRVQVGEEDSLWRLKLVRGENGLEATLHRRDYLDTELEVHLCLTASLGNLSSSGTTIGLVGCRGGLGVGNPPDHLVTSPLALPWDSQWDSQGPAEKKGISLPWDHPALQPSLPGCEQGNLKVDASLLVSRSIDARKRKASLVLVQGRSLAFGPVEEVHYLEEKQKAPLASRLSRGLLTLVSSVQAGSNRDPYMLLHCS